MRARRLVVAVAVSVALTPVLPPTTAVAQHRAGPCGLHAREGESTQDFSKRLIRCSIRRLGSVPGGAKRAICIAKRESGLIPTASSPTGKYLGLFQHARKYWPGRYDDHTEPQWELPTRAKHGRTNAIVTVRMVRHHGTWKDAGWRVKGCR
jgi:hypothetical protein